MQVPQSPVLCHWCHEKLQLPLMKPNSAKDGEGFVYHPDCLVWAAKVWAALYLDNKPA